MSNILMLVVLQWAFVFVVTPAHAQAGPEVTISAAQRSRLDAEVAQLPGDVRERFEKFYQDWKRGWRRPGLLVRSDPGKVREIEEFHALVALGPQILPLVVTKLLHPDEFFALQLYDVLQDRPELQATERFRGEQRRALQAAHLWLSR